MAKLLARPDNGVERLEPPGPMTTSMPSRGSVGGWGDEAHSICSRLVRETGCAEPEAAIAVGRAMERFRGARIREFVALLAERDARRLLRAREVDPMKTIELDARQRRGTSREDRNGRVDR
jgi:hypothetical protein